MKDLLLSIAKRLMRCPAAPYHEGLVAREAVRICKEYGLLFEFDAFGNLLVGESNASPAPPLILAAHMDHPGFVVQERLSEKVYKAEFLGGVGDAYFKPGVRLVCHPSAMAAKLGKRLDEKRREFEIEVLASHEVPPKFAVWDLPGFQLRGEKIRGRVCDDLIGVAVILTVLIQLQEQKVKRSVIGAITRAEEVGFHGALALANSRRLPSHGLIVSLETSRELPVAKMDGGVIVRVGDRASVFDSAGTRFLSEVAAELAKSKAGFKFQRALMSGGTCEATAYQEYGYRCAGVCVALGNYHNCGPNEKIGAEFVSAADAAGMAELLLNAAREMRNYEQISGRLPKRLQTSQKEALRKLRANPLKVENA